MVVATLTILEGAFMLDNAILAEFLNNSQQPDKSLTEPDVALADVSAKDKSWDKNRAQAQAVEEIYRKYEHYRYAERMHDCALVLWFARLTLPLDGSSRLQLREAHFCKVRLCPLCQVRRQLMHQSRFFKALPRLQADFPKARWIFLSLTLRNCPVSSLRETLQAMNKAWNRLRLRPEFKPIIGWVKLVELTYSSSPTGDTHPHFHALLMVPPSMFAKNYVSQARWSELWKSTLRIDYTPIVDVRTVRPQPGHEESALASAVKETFKYSVKSSDMTAHPEWFIELTNQIQHLRFISAGGILKKLMKPDKKETDKDLVLAETKPDEPDDGNRFAFDWRRVEKKYRRQPKHDYTCDP
jgi:plasmid rolling circle replication initiator protein Rep